MSSEPIRPVVNAVATSISLLAVPCFLSVVSADIVRFAPGLSQASSPLSIARSAMPLAITEPLMSMLPLACCRPANTVSFPRYAEKIPVDRTVKANTEATTTNAIKMIAVSRPVTPSSTLRSVRDDVFSASKTRSRHLIGNLKSDNILVSFSHPNAALTLGFSRHLNYHRFIPIASQQTSNSPHSSTLYLMYLTWL